MTTRTLVDALPKLASAPVLTLGAGDILIHAPGFEERTMAILGLIGGASRSSAVLLDYRPYNAGNKLSAVREGLAERGVDTPDHNIIEYDRFDPTAFTESLRRRLASGVGRAYVDVSTMSKLAVMLALTVCRDLDLEVFVVYSEADSYGPDRLEFELAKGNSELHRPSLQVYSGIHGVVRVGDLASVAMQGQPTAALVFMSLNDALTQVLLNTVYPSRLLLINGSPPVHGWREYATAWIHDEVRREWAEDNPVVAGPAGPLPARAVSTLDYRDTVGLLIDLYWSLSDTHRILLAPAGSKMQAVGCFFAKALHPDIHIEYPSPEGFLKEYSRGIGPQWLLPLGRLTKLIVLLTDLERQRYLELAV